MKKHMTTKTLLIAAALFLGVAGEARADGVAIPSDALPSEQRDALAQQVAEARAQNPEAFAAVAAVDTYKPEGIRRSRLNKPEAARAFMRLGRPALMPMIELVAFQAERGSLTDAQWNALGTGLLHAIAFLRDDRAAPVLEAVFLDGQQPSFVRKAGEGLGMLSGKRQNKLLLRASRGSGAQRLGAITGLGWCRNKTSAERLAAIFAEPLDAETALVTAKALGNIGSSWGIAADKSISSERGEAIRRIASEVLVDQYSRYGKKVRDATSTSVLMVEHPASLGRIESVRRRVDQSTAEELDSLRNRLERSLAR